LPSEPKPPPEDNAPRRPKRGEGDRKSTKGELYRYHEIMGSLGIYYTMYPYG
jgi:hypothetical protein